MSTIRIALANIRYAESPEDSIVRAEQWIARAGALGAETVCFPEAYVPGYRGCGHMPPPPDEAFLERAWQRAADAAHDARVAVILGTERIREGRLYITSLVLTQYGTIAGFQDKVQLDPSEDALFTPAEERSVFQCGEMKFGISICHEGWRYPETVRWAARHGAQVVFHPHLHKAEPGDFAPTSFADPRNSFHEKAMLCRAAENTIYFASVNYASANSPTTSAIVRPDGTVLAWQPYGEEGLLVADLDLTQATGWLASRCRS